MISYRDSQASVSAFCKNRKSKYLMVLSPTDVKPKVHQWETLFKNKNHLTESNLAETWENNRWSHVSLRKQQHGKILDIFNLQNIF